MESKIPALPLLEPLTRATQTTLRPLPLNRTDFLEIDIDDDDNFVVEPIALREVNGNDRLLNSPDIRFVQISDGLFWEDERFRSYTSRTARSDWFRRVPESKPFSQWSTKKVLAGTDFSALVIHHMWPHEHLLFLSEAAQLFYTLLLKRFLVQTKAAHVVAKWKSTGECPEMPSDFVDCEQYPYENYQKVGILASLIADSYALFLQQGLGKTAIVIGRVCLEAARKMKGDLPDAKKGMFRALIICPRQVRLNWQREFKRFATNPGKTVVLRGGMNRRVRCLIQGIRAEDDCEWSVNIVSIDQAAGMTKILTKLRWDLVVFDESHKMKSPTSQRWKSLKLFDDTKARSKMVLTGTPIANGPWDLWTQLEFLGQGLSGFKSHKNFKMMFGKWNKEPGSSVMKLQKLINAPLIQERLARLAFLLTRKDSGVKMPEEVYDYWEVEMSSNQKTAYCDMAKHLVVEINTMMAEAKAEGRVCSADHILTKLLRLAQITSGHIKVEDIEGGTFEVMQLDDENAKVEAVLEILKEDHENDLNSKAVIWCHFIEDVRIVSEGLTRAGIVHTGYHRCIDSKYKAANPQEAEDELNLNPQCRVLVGNPQSAGVGQNYIGFDRNDPGSLDTYVDHHLFFSSNWSSIDRRQAQGRSTRRDSRDDLTLRITDVLVPGTIDQEIRERVQGKIAMATTIQDVKNILSKVLEEYEG